MNSTNGGFVAIEGACMVIICQQDHPSDFQRLVTLQPCKTPFAPFVGCSVAIYRGPKSPELGAVQEKNSPRNGAEQ